MLLKFLKWFFGIFSTYVNSFERRVDRFFRNIKSTDGLASIKEKLIDLMQENLIVVNVWLEKKFKGYTYLSKSVRKKMYEDVLAINKKFAEFCLQNSVDDKKLREILSQTGVTYPEGDSEKLAYLYQIMQFLKPGHYYYYIKTASFGKLLRNPEHEKLEGDCNQIVTLYIYLYSLKFPLQDLNIKLLPEHVCLHFRNIDIEATNGTFAKYTENRDVLPVTEIISTNLLDLADFREEVQEISAETMVKSAQLGYAISSLKPLVAKNLNIAYHNLGAAALNSRHFETAIFYFEKADSRENLIAAYRQAAVYYLDQKNFSKAQYYADKSGDGVLAKNVKYNEGVYYYNADQLDKALSIFGLLGDEKMKKACYQKQYNALVGKVASVKTLEDARKKKSIYQQMLSVAEKIGDEILEKSVRDTLSKI